MLRPTQAAWSAATLVALAGLAACTTSLSGGARDTFARTARCASGPVTVVPRPDYRPHASEPAPPDESADPGKLVYWQQRREPSRPTAPDADCEVFEVTGCGQQLLFCCRHPWARDSTGVVAARSDVVACEAR
jgi:hypothetical protein